jgi:glycosyltransferase involved in cell wall biosynthesis
MHFRSLPSPPPRSRRWLGRLITALEQEGLRSLARRKLSQTSALLAERLRVRQMRLGPWIADDRPVFLLISHRCGGGTERHLCDLEASLRSDGVRPVVVRPGRTGRLLWEERGDGRKIRWCREQNTDSQSIAELLRTIAPAHAHVHHALGLPEALFDALADRGVPYDWTIHDYHSICPRINLIGSDGRYCGEPDEAGCNRCLAQLGDDQGLPVHESIADWRRRSARRLKGARRVFAPSADVARRLERYFPDRALTLRPHAESLPSLGSLAAPMRPGETIRIAVIGTLVAVKGSRRLLACAQDARRRTLPLEFHVIGSTDRDAALLRLGNVHISGRYREREVFALLARGRPHLAFLPSECPESYMFTLSTAMASGLFVVCFALGAQAERVRSWGWGRPLDFELTPAELNDELIRAAHALAGNPKPPPPPMPAYYRDMLISYYDFTDQDQSPFAGCVAPDSDGNNSIPLALPGRGHAHLH